VNKVEEFTAANDTGDVRSMLAAGSAGMAAASSIVVKKAMTEMLY